MKDWEEFLKVQEKDLGQAIVDRWLRPLKIVHFDAGNLYLEAQDTFQAAWFEEQMREKTRLLLRNNNNRPIKVHLACNEAPLTPKKGQKKSGSWKPTLSLLPDTLDSKNTFANYVGQTVPFQLFQDSLTKPGAFNPIYLHGATGSGKTHLLMAAAHYLKSSGLSCFYVRADTFTEHVVSAIRNSSMQKFREIYRNHDVLLVDDIHILSGKTATQEEFFHTFNALHTSGRQIILSSTSLPSQLPAIEPRLTSRFEWGLVLPVPTLDRAHLKELLQLRTESLQVTLQPPVHTFLLTHFSQPKSLLQALDALLLRAHLDHLNLHQLTALNAAHILTKLLEAEKKQFLTPEKIVQAVAETYGIKADDILGKSQTQECVLPRQIAMYFCRTILKMPFIKIAAHFDRDHSTVMTSVKLIQKKREEKEMISLLEQVQRKF